MYSYLRTIKLPNIVLYLALLQYIDCIVHIYFHKHSKKIKGGEWTT